MVRLSVVASEPCDPRQIDLAGEAAAEAGLDRLCDLLGARLGLAQVTRLTPADSHIPERACRAAAVAEAAGRRQGDLTSPSRGGRPRGARPGGVLQRDLDRCGQSEVEPVAEDPTPAASQPTLPARGRVDWTLAPPPPDRPPTLFARPEPVEVIAEVPEGPPLRFRWRRAVHEVARAEGPERIAPEWWRDDAADAPTRDYYRVEDAEGRRFWIYRAGLYGRETDRPAWFIHGLFA